MNVIDRKKAADLLQVSIRTLDRYISKGILPKQDIAGRIVIKFKDLKPLLEQKKLEGEYLNSLNSNYQKERNRQSEQQGSDTQYSSSIQPEYQSHATASEAFVSVNETEDSPIYQKLYEQLQEELKTKQERLEGANYRVGQLEGLLKESVPLLDYRKSMALEQQKREELEQLLDSFEKDNETLNQTVEAKRTELEQISKKLQQEKNNKKIFLIILIVLFLLQPLWLLFPPVIN